MQASCASLLLASMSSNMSPCISLHNGAEPLRRGASPLRPAEFPVYAYTTSFGLLLFHSANTRYEWMANPYTAGTCTPQEAPSFAWRTEDEDEPSRIPRAPLSLAAHRFWPYPTRPTSHWPGRRRDSCPSKAIWPLTIVQRNPSAYWCGSVKVVFSRRVSGSNTVMSAQAPSAS